MAAPITWRNVDSGGAAVAGAALGAAGNSINGAFDIFNKIIQQRQNIDQANLAAVDEAGKQTYLDTLAGAKTPEALAALEASGKLAEARTGLTAASRAAIRGSDEARLNAVRTNVNSAAAFDDTLRKRTEAPLVEQALARITAAPADPATRKLIEDSPIRDKTAIWAAYQAQNDRLVAQTRAAELHPFAVDAARRNQTIGNIQVTEAQRAADAATQERTFAQLLTNESAGYQKYQKEIKDGIVVGLASYKDAKSLPRNSDGTLADDLLTAEQKAAFNSHLRSKGLPTLVQLGDDTAAAAAFEARLQQAGASPADIARLKPGIAQGFTSTPTAPIGREAEKIARQLRGQAAEEALSASQYGSATNQGDRAKILEAAQQALALKIDPKERPAAFDKYQRAVSEFIDGGGIPIMDAKGNVLERVLPSPEQMKLLLSKVNAGTFWATTYQSDVGDVLNAWTENNRDKQGVKDFIKFRDRKLLMGVDPPGKR